MLRRSRSVAPLVIEIGCDKQRHRAGETQYRDRNGQQHGGGIVDCYRGAAPRPRQHQEQLDDGNPGRPASGVLRVRSDYPQVGVMEFDVAQDERLVQWCDTRGDGDSGGHPVE